MREVVENNKNRQWGHRGLAASRECWGSQMVGDTRTFLSGNKSVKTRLDGVELKVRNKRRLRKIGRYGRQPCDLP
jgi:hypothetical protein